MIAVILGFVAAAGCVPRVLVRKDPGPHTKGIRYYRPKPYLFIAPAGEKTVTTPLNPTEESTTKTVTVPTDEFVSIDLQWLPDFSEEYAIDIRTGFGTNATELTLEDGWNLTALNTKLDSQTDENINAFANLLESVGSLAAPVGMNPAPPADASKGRVVVRATNVPLGYYESVLGRDHCGRKKLYGWRYVGFIPYSQCPIIAGGAEKAYCDTLDLYGLVFDNGIMTFKQLCSVEQLGQTRNYVYPRKNDQSDEGSDQPPIRTLDWGGCPEVGCHPETVTAFQE